MISKPKISLSCPEGLGRFLRLKILYLQIGIRFNKLILFEQVEEYKQVNLKESHDLADAFLAYPFLDAQYRFLKSKGKSQTAAVFWLLKTSRPIWSKFL